MQIVCPHKQIFPVFVPESLTCLTVWKRYNDVKKLRKQIVRRHKDLHLQAPPVPPLNDDGYFRRFDAEVIHARKQHILHFLDYIAQYPCLYKCHAFVQFFEASQSPTLSPLRRRNSNIATICGEIAVPPLAGSDEYNLIDPQRDQQQPAEAQPRNSISMTSSSSVSSETMSACSEAEDVSVASVSIASTTPQPGLSSSASSPVDEVDCAIEAFDDGLVPMDGNADDRLPVAPVTTSDYIFEAALEFSDAVRAEVSRNYRQSFELYKSGIGILMRGVRADANAERRRIAKDKINKYLLRAEQIHACQLLDGSDHNNHRLENTPSRGYNNRSGNDRLVAYEELGRIKVLKVMHGVMQVQDTLDQSVHIMKAIEKPANFSVQLFEHEHTISGMVRLINYFVSETTVYLLLQQANGGRLWDYIRNYREHAVDEPQTTENGTLNSLFLDPAVEATTRNAASDSDSDVDDDAFLGTLKKLRTPNHRDYRHGADAPNSLDEALEQLERNAPAFDMLTPTMTVADLLDCSQQLLQSVTSTLERSMAADVVSVERFKCTIIDEPTVKPVEEIFLSQGTTAQNCMEGKSFGNAAVPKKPLTATTRAHRIPQRCIVRWASELCQTIADLHANGIVCGDLHASNLLLGTGGQLLLSYVHRGGSSCGKAEHGADGRLSASALDGLYVAPERPLTAASDWWTFGVLLFELLTGERFVDCHPSGTDAYYDVQFPVNCALSPDARDLVTGTVQSDVDLRLGEEAIRGHRFFRDIQ